MRRDHNEDGFYASDEAGIWLVADGMGGLERGERASSIVVEAVSSVLVHRDLEATLDAADAALQWANERILGESEQLGKQMGSTAVVLVACGNRFGISWVGDSRAYLLRGGRLFQLTRDHSQVQEMIDEGMIAEAAASSHPLRHVLTRAIGVERPLEIASVVGALQDDDLVLLCSDGLHGVVGEAGLQETLSSMPFAEAAPSLIERCYALGAPDNITLIGVTMSEITFVPSEGRPLADLP